MELLIVMMIMLLAALCVCRGQQHHVQPVLLRKLEFTKWRTPGRRLLRDVAWPPPRYRGPHTPSFSSPRSELGLDRADQRPAGNPRPDWQRRDC